MYQQQSGLRQKEQNGRHQDAPSTNDAAILTDSINRLSLATGTAASLPGNVSRSASPRSAERVQFDARRASPSHAQQYGPRKTPSSTSLRGDRRGSTPNLQKKISTGSLRSSHTAGFVSPPRSRRGSPNFLSSPTNNMGSKSPLGRSSYGSAQRPGPAAPTAATIASDYFNKELEFHRSTNTKSKTVVIIHDACYGHRFSRPRTSKAALSTIVERPERIQASIWGLSTAYVRMGQRHEGGCFAPHPDLNPQLLPTPPFLFRKTDRSMAINSPAVTHVHGIKWMEDLKAMCGAAGDRLALNGKELVRPRSSGKDENGPNGQKLHEGDLYLCPESLNAFEGALGGVCEAVDSVFESGPTRRAFVCIRPPGHHCSAHDPSGFCWLNNVHVGIAYGAMKHGLTHAAILDFDLHHGDGSQAIAWEQNRKAASSAKNAAQHKKTAIGYFSLHDINSYPCEMGDEEKVRNASVCIDNAHGQSVWNVHLESWKNPAEFWELYNNKYSVLLQKTREFLHLHTQRLRSSPNGPAPRAAIFLSAGFDASEWEGAGMQRHKVNVPTDFYARFTSDVVRIAEEEGLGVDGRVVSVLEGGYSDRALMSGILSHVSGLADIGPNMPNKAEDNGLASEMFNRLGLDDAADHTDPYGSRSDTATFDSDWWRLPLLEELEVLVNPPPPPPLKKAREKPASTYSSPTQSFKAKIVTPTRKSSIFQPGSKDSVVLPPPLPDVDWATAAHELSKLLIPSDRQTMSCRHDELSADANRARHERPSTAYADPMASDGKRMKLRERKPKISTPAQPSRPCSRSKSTRRTTIADAADLPAPSTVKPSDNGRNGSRRLSVASSIIPGANRTQESKPNGKGPGRPATKAQPSTSSRPASSIGVKPGNPFAKRPRVPSTSRVSTAKTRTSPRKIPPVPPIPSYNSSPSTTPATIPELGKSESHTGQSTPLSANRRVGDQDFDSLTKEVKKLSIKLKVPSPEENAIREKKASEERKKLVSKSSKNGLAKRTVSSSSNAKENSTGPAYFNQASVSTPELEKDDPSAEPTVPLYPYNQPFQENWSLPTPGPASLAEPAQQPLNLAMSPPQTPGLCHPTPQPQITIKSPPANKPTKEDLPHFTPTSAIPFAPAAVQNRPTHQQQNNVSRPTSPHSRPLE